MKPPAMLKLLAMTFLGTLAFIAVTPSRTFGPGRDGKRGRDGRQGPDDPLTPAEARALAEQAYLFGYPMVEHYKTMYGFAIDTRSPTYSGFNRFQHNRKLYDPDFKLVVTPNNDTLYSTAFADLRSEPLVMRMPASGDRYYVLQLVDYGTDNFAYIGTRATGRDGGSFALVGPDYKGSLPAERFSRVIVAPSAFVALALRTAVGGIEDTPGAVAFQDRIELFPLSQFLGTPAPAPAPAIDFPPYDQERAQGIGFFHYLDMVMDWHTPRLDEGALLQRMARLGVLPGGVDGFHADRFSPQLLTALEEGIRVASQAIEERSNHLGERIDGWEYTPPMGHFGTDYLFRAAVARKFMYTNDREEALYPIANVDSEGRPLDGGSRYVLRFAKDGMPPAAAFWSVTLYDASSRLLVHNAIRRYSIGDRTPGVKPDADGGLTLYIQHDSPGPEQESNWLPAPAGPFYLILRAYMPRPEILDGRYRIPPLQRVRR